MQLNSVRELKHNIFSSYMVSANALTPLASLGISKKGKEHILAVRHTGVNVRGFLELYDYISKISKGEVDYDVVGDIYAGRPAPLNDQLWRQKRTRPLKIGVSIGHEKITAGTLGCFVRLGKSDDTFVLSNNHVMANCNNAKEGDYIRQPGNYDRGTETDRIAQLTKFVALKENGNLVDAALAKLNNSEKFDSDTITDIGKLHKDINTEVELGMEVAKFGRTTGARRGVVSGIEMSNVRVSYPNSVLTFDDQIEITSSDDRTFSEGGDSGSLVVDSKCRAVGLLFAGSPYRTYINAIKNVFYAFGSEMRLA